MNGTEDAPQVVTAVLPNGNPVKIELTGAGSGDGMASVGLRDLDLGAALDRVGEIGSLVVDKLKAAKPRKTTVELHLGFAVEAGKLTALWVGGKGEASLTVTMEWSEPDPPAPAPGPALTAAPASAPAPGPAPAPGAAPAPAPGAAPAPAPGGAAPASAPGAASAPAPASAPTPTRDDG